MFCAVYGQLVLLLVHNAFLSLRFVTNPLFPWETDFDCLCLFCTLGFCLMIVVRKSSAVLKINMATKGYFGRWTDVNLMCIVMLYRHIYLHFLTQVH